MPNNVKLPGQAPNVQQFPSNSIPVLGLVETLPVTDTLVGIMKPIKISNEGVQYTTTVIAGLDAVTGRVINFDAIDPTTVIAPDSAAFMHAFNGATFDRVRSGGDDIDSVAPEAVGVLPVGSRQMMYDGVGFERVRSNRDETIINEPAIPNGNTETSPEQTNHNHSGCLLYIDTTPTPAGTNYQVTLQGVTPNGNFVDLSGPHVFDTGQPVVQFSMYPGAVDTLEPARVITNGMLPRRWRFVIEVVGGGPLNVRVNANVGMM